MRDRGIVRPGSILAGDTGRGGKAVQFVTDPDADDIESEGLEAGVDLALEELTEDALKAAAWQAVRHRADLPGRRENLALGKFHDLASDAASDVRNA